MKISINGTETQEASFQGETLGEVLHAILNSRRDSYIRRVWLDGQEASSNTQDTLKTSTASVESLKLELALLQDLVDNNLTNAKEYLEKLVPGFQKAATCFAWVTSRRQTNIICKSLMALIGSPRLF